MKTYDLLSNLRDKERVRCRVLAYVMDDVSNPAFLRSTATLAPDCKIVQARIGYIDDGSSEYILEAWVYMSVPLDLEVGSFYTVSGTFTSISSVDFSKEVGMLTFKRVSGSWVIFPCRVTKFDIGLVRDATLRSFVEYWLTYKYTLTGSDHSIVTPVTKLVEGQVLYGTSSDRVGVSITLPVVSLERRSDMSDLQLGVLGESLSSPVLQVMVENENLVSVEGLVGDIKHNSDTGVTAIDLRGKEGSLYRVVDELREREFFTKGDMRVIVIVSHVQEGIPYVVVRVNPKFLEVFHVK